MKARIQKLTLKQGAPLLVAQLVVLRSAATARKKLWIDVRLAKTIPAQTRGPE